MSGLARLRKGLSDGDLTPRQAVTEASGRLRAGDPCAVIAFVPDDALERRFEALQGIDPASLPLFGIPFAVKDNIDVEGVPTTAGCPGYAYLPQRSATVVRRLEAAGAVAVAKTNLDQFATGLVGTRSPYGTPTNVWDRRRVPGGSSSGSAVVVASGAVPFALGTDTAGSGRVPAAFAGVVGAKPTLGWLSTLGVVPAVRTIDCVSVFALSVGDAWDVLGSAGGYDAEDPYSRRQRRPESGGARIGVGRGLELGFDLSALGDVTEVDLDGFLRAGSLLYDGPWVAERLAAVGDFVLTHPDEVDPSVGHIVEGARRWTAADSAEATYRLAAIRRQLEKVWDEIEVLVLPTAPAPPTLDQVAADPIGANAALGVYTTFANLLDLCAFAVPTGMVDGLPSSAQIIAPAWSDAVAARWADRIHRSAGGLRGRTGTEGPEPWTGPGGPAATVDLAVVGAHLRGQPLHHELVALGARWVADGRTAPNYRLYALAGTTPPKPGLVRTSDDTGSAIEVEVYRLSVESFGRFVAAVPAPLCIGTVLLESGPVAGFLCEPASIEGSIDITSYGGWRSYRA